VVAAICAGTAGLTAATAAGSARAQASITGGHPANPAAWGFTVAILERGKLACSGSVIAPTKVLTAAHCARGDPTRLVVVANRLALRNTAVGEAIGVTGAAVHPDFPLTRLHDLAVLTLAQPTTAPAIALPDPTEPINASPVPGNVLQIAGFGARNPIAAGKAKLGRLFATTVRVRTACRRYGPRFFETSMICALGKPIGRLVLNRSACFGDSGGPMVLNSPLGPRLVGVSSYVVSVVQGRFRGALCGFHKAPAVWARVSDGLDFIQENLAG
jgi:secreted trypsin-like serine protease